MTVDKHKVVTLEYTLKNNEGEVLDTSMGRAPLVYLHGVGTLIPGLENELHGKSAGEKLNITIQPEDAYGRRNDNLIRVVEKSGFQGDEEMMVGMQVQLETDQGPAIATISDIDGEKVTLDMNHPLADMILNFDIELVEVRDANAEEIAHGHVHGPGGHHH